MAPTEKKKFVGVAIFVDSKSSKGDHRLTALRWAAKEFDRNTNPLPKGCKLCVIVIKRADVESTAGVVPLHVCIIPISF